MSDSNQIQMSFAPEAVFNQHPGESAVWSGMRILSDSLKANFAMEQSNEIRNYRDIPELNEVDRSNDGAINQSLYYDDNDIGQKMRYGLGSGAWSSEAATITAALCTITAVDNTITLGAGNWDNIPSIGSWIYVSGSTKAANNGLHKIIGGSGSTIVVPDYLEDDAAVSLTIVELSQITNGTTFQSCSIERIYTDLASIVEQFTGDAINGFSVDANGQGTVKFTTDWVGVGASSGGALTSIDNAFATTPEMKTGKGVQWVREGTGAAMADMKALGFSFQVANGLRNQYELGTFGAADMKLGDFVPQGTIQAIFKTADLMDKYLNQTATSLAMAVADNVTGRGNAYIFEFPKIKFTAGQRVAGGRNTDIIADMSWQAIYDNAGHSMKVAKIASA